MAENFKFQTNIPLTFTPKYDKGIEQDPPPNHPEYGKSWSWGVIVNGVEGFIRVSPMLNDLLLNAGIKSNQPITVTKKEAQNGIVEWEVKNGGVTNETAQPAPTPQPDSKNASELNFELSKKDLWIRLQALYKATDSSKNYMDRVKETIFAEKLLRKAVNDIVAGAEVTTDKFQEYLESLEVPF